MLPKSRTEELLATKDEEVATLKEEMAVLKEHLRAQLEILEGVPPQSVTTIHNEVSRVFIHNTISHLTCSTVAKSIIRQKLRGVDAPLKASKGHAIQPTSYHTIRSISQLVIQGSYPAHKLQLSAHSKQGSILYRAHVV